MIKTLLFGEKQISFSTSFAWCFIYKSQFHKDPAQVVVPAAKQVMADGGINDPYNVFEILGFVETANIAWSMARLANPDTPDPEAWITSLADDFDLTEIMINLIPDAIESCFSTKKSKAPVPPAKKAAPKK